MGLEDCVILKVLISNGLRVNSPTVSPESIHHQICGFKLLIGISQANGCLTVPALSLNDTKDKAIFFFRFFTPQVLHLHLPQLQEVEYVKSACSMDKGA